MEKDVYLLKHQQEPIFVEGWLRFTQDYTRAMRFNDIGTAMRKAAEINKKFHLTNGNCYQVIHE